MLNIFSGTIGRVDQGQKMPVGLRMTDRHKQYCTRGMSGGVNKSIVFLWEILINQSAGGCLFWLRNEALLAFFFFEGCIFYLRK